MSRERGGERREPETPLLRRGRCKRHVVVPQCEPARKHRHARRGRASFDGRAALRQSVGRSGAGLPADALTDELTTGLARILGAFVIARKTALTFKGKPVDAKTIGKDLGVRYVLEGSVQPGGNQVRVNAQLIDADSGAHLWADQFDAARADLFQVQDEIVTRLAHAMELQLTKAEAARLKRTPTANPSAEDLALQCVAAVQKGGYGGKESEAGYGLCEQGSLSIPTMSAP